MRALWTVLETYGVPGDRAGWAVYTPTSGTAPDRRRLTQVGRALARLGIEHERASAHFRGFVSRRTKVRLTSHLADMRSPFSEPRILTVHSSHPLRRPSHEA
jgi:hypothetical protein